MRRLVMATVMAGLSSIGDATYATDYTWAPYARSMMRIEDNIRGATVNPERAWGFDLGGGLNLKAQNDTLSSELIPRFNVRRFAIGDNLNADEYSVAFNNDWLQERYSTGLDVSYIRDSTLTSETTDNGGLRQDVTDRDSVSIQPSLTWFTTDKLSVQTSFAYNDVSYIDAGNTGYEDYRYLLGSLGANYLWRENLSIFSNFFVTDFAVSGGQSTTRSYGGQTGATWQWPDQLKLSGALGWISSSIDFLDQRFVVVADPVPRIALVSFPAQASSSGPIASVTIEKNFELTQAKFDYSRQVSPSGRGSQSTADRIALHVERRMDDRTSLLFDGLHEMRTAQSEAISGLPSGSIFDLNRDYSEVRGGIRYRIAREWSTSFAYRFAHRSNTGTSRVFTADSNSIYLTLEFYGLPHQFNFGF